VNTFCRGLWKIADEEVRGHAFGGICAGVFDGTLEVNDPVDPVLVPAREVEPQQAGGPPVTHRVSGAKAHGRSEWVTLSSETKPRRVFGECLSQIVPSDPIMRSALVPEPVCTTVYIRRGATEAIRRGATEAGTEPM
jgi:hypothetical protein